MYTFWSLDLELDLEFNFECLHNDNFFVSPNKEDIIVPVPQEPIVFDYDAMAQKIVESGKFRQFWTDIQNENEHSSRWLKMSKFCRQLFRMNFYKTQLCASNAC